MTSDINRYVYGPVASRRLGRSLGIDLVPFKTCSYDCVYCQLGRTTNKTISLREYVPVDDLLVELAQSLDSERPPDFIGLAGSGEPTLHSRIGELLAGIKRITSIPVAVLTNGSMLWMPEVRTALAGADLVLPSLDAGNWRSFARVNRPHPEITFRKMVGGLTAFAEGFRGEIWLEVFVVAGITDRPDEIRSIGAIAGAMHPARVQLNTVCRPPAEHHARAVSRESLERLCAAFSGNCEVIAEDARPQAARTAAAGDVGGEVLALLGRRPCTVKGISDGLGVRPNEVIKRLEALRQRGLVRTARANGVVFYQAVKAVEATDRTGGERR